jgi:hypothetical protein
MRSNFQGVADVGGGFYINCFPHKIPDVPDGWTRAVAIFNDALTPNKKNAAHSWIAAH